MKELPSQGTPGGGPRASLPATGRLGESRLRSGVPGPSQETEMRRCETPLHEAERAEEAARALCRVAYEDLLAARARSPRNALILAAYQGEVARAERHHMRVLARLWRARVAHCRERSGACA